MGKKRGYSYKAADAGNSCQSKASNMRVHFKHAVEIAKVIRGMKIKRSIAYLMNVLAGQECVPFRKFNSGVGRCAQAKAFKTTQGRWPKKSTQCLLDLLHNAVSNAEFKGIDYENLYVAHIQVNPAQLSRRRTFRAHGRITPFMGHNCHIEVVLEEGDNYTKKF